MPSPDDSIETLRRLFDGVWNGENPDVADDLVSPEYVIHDRDLADDLRGPDLYRALAAGTREIFPDAAFEIEDAFAADGKVALRWTMTGTHEGPLLGIEPTGTPVELTAIEIDRFADGQLVETWSQSDMLGVVHQVGGFPDADEG